MQWAELPAGHFISGRSPKVQQFALTPQQLSIRETFEREMDEELSSPHASIALERYSEGRRSGDAPRRSSLALSRSLSRSPDRDAFVL